MKNLILLIIAIVFCLSGQAQTLNEGFDGTTFPPAGWQNLQVSGSGVWNRLTIGIQPVCAPHSGAGMAYYNCYKMSAGTNAILVSPPLVFSGSAFHILSFWKYSDVWMENKPDSIGVYYNSSASLTGARWLATIPRYNAVQGWYNHTYIIPGSVSGTQYIIFRGYSHYGNNIFIDDVSLITAATHDFAAISVNNNEYLTHTTPIIPSATIKNMGTSSESNVIVNCRIYNYSNNQIYTNTQVIPNLASLASTNVNFASFTLPNAESIYKIKIWSSLSGDANPGNDTIVKTVYTYTHNKQNVLVELGTGTW